MFTAPRAGVYLVTFSYQGFNIPGKGTLVYLHLNGVRLGETRHGSGYGSGGSDAVWSTGGRTVYQSLEAGDRLTLQTGYVSGVMEYIMFCVELNN